MSKRTRAAVEFLQQTAATASSASSLQPAVSAAVSASAAAQLQKKLKLDHPQLAPLLTDFDTVCYPAGRRDTTSLTQFQRRVYAATRLIPRGSVATYKTLAESIGCPRAYRAVGNALRHNPFAPAVPCHRVLPSDGRLGGFAGGIGPCGRTEKKRAMLQAEGLCFESDGETLKKTAEYRAKVIVKVDASKLDEEALTDEKLRA